MIRRDSSGNTVGTDVGDVVGSAVGVRVGLDVGLDDGIDVGEAVGEFVGDDELQIPAPQIVPFQVQHDKLSQNISLDWSAQF